jgi:hypothetical protein
MTTTKKRMNETEWFASNDSYRMLRPCRKVIRSQPRKGRLFAVACCYRIWHLLADPRSRAAVETAAQYADGLVSEDKLRAAADAAGVAHDEAFRVKGKVGACGEWAAEFGASLNAWHAAQYASNFAYVAAGDGLEPGPEHEAQAHLLRCIFGPLPFRAISLDLAWLVWNAGTIPRLAEAIYEESAFARLPILADALEDAGCTEADLLSHFRSPGPHGRGCWALDLVLGKR